MSNMAVVLVLGLAAAACAMPPPDAKEQPGGFQPRHVHLAIGESPRDMVVTWTTWDPTPSRVEYGVLAGPEEPYDSTWLTLEASGSYSNFTDGGDERRSMMVHRVTLTDLLPDTTYVYHCGSEFGWSSIFLFRTWPAGDTWQVSVAMYGDLGTVNTQSITRLQHEVQAGRYHAVFHIGDFAYQLDSDNARLGDTFMDMIEPVAAYLPYMVSPGNHEVKYNFSNYRARFTMPQYQESENYFYSFNMGPVHFISISTEVYYYLYYGYGPLERQLEWLIKDLEEAARPEVRAVRPWIVLYGHRPMYCTNDDGDDCTHHYTLTRVGLPLLPNTGMERLLLEYGVDLAVWAHEHSYERLWPMYNFQVLNGSTEAPYTNPRGPVHFTTGSAGCRHGHNDFIPDPPSWSAFRTVDYGYTRLQVHNATHLYWEQVSEDQGGEVVDSVWLVRDVHQPYPTPTPGHQ